MPKVESSGQRLLGEGERLQQRGTRSMRHKMQNWLSFDG